MGAKKRGFALFAVALTMATVASAEEARREGVIVTRADNSLNVRTREGPLTVVVTPQTTIRETSGLLQRRTRGPHSVLGQEHLAVVGQSPQPSASVYLRTENSVSRHRGMTDMYRAPNGNQFPVRPAPLRHPLIDLE